MMVGHLWVVFRSVYLTMRKHTLKESQSISFNHSRIMTKDGDITIQSLYTRLQKRPSSISGAFLEFNRHQLHALVKRHLSWLK